MIKFSDLQLKIYGKKLKMTRGQTRAHSTIFHSNKSESADSSVVSSSLTGCLRSFVRPPSCFFFLPRQKKPFIIFGPIFADAEKNSGAVEVRGDREDPYHVVAG